MEVINLSENSINALNKLIELYKNGKVFVAKGDPEVQRTCEVYLTACSLADEIGKDMAKHLKTDAIGHGSYEIISNMKMIVRHHVGGHNGKASGYCAVSVCDTDTGKCHYLGITKC